jgi:hydroxyacylglutathione hydrolase
MFLKQLYDQPLAQASYLIGCQATGEAIVVDPLRDPAPYLELARAQGLHITHITETHIHADFVSGARELAAATGGHLLLSAEGGEDWQYRFAAADGATMLHDGDQFMVGNVRFDVMHTPGHTPEHLSFVVTDTPRAAGPMGILTGDWVFVGDVGRPDLLEKAAKVANTMEAGARMLFGSLQRFRTLPDHWQVWPGHGAGSACGKALGAVPSSTVGYEKRANWGVGATSEAEFVTAVLEGQPEPPRYFAEMKRINRDGPAVLGALSPLPALTGLDVGNRVAAGAWPIDVRSAAAFAEGFLPGSLSVPYSNSFSTWVGSLVPYTVDIVLLAPAADGALVDRARRDLSRIGLDRVVGWASPDEVLAAHTARGGHRGTVEQLSAVALANGTGLPAAHTVVDVRSRSEWGAGHVPGAVHIPMGELADRLGELPKGPLLVHCQSGARSAVATSLLHRLGRADARNVTGGYVAWRDARRGG